MKLINKISINFLISAFIVFISISLFLYLAVEKTLKDETDEQLINTYHKIAEQLNKGEKISFPPFVEIIPVNGINFSPGFKDVYLNSNGDDSDEPFRQYSSIINISGDNYILIVRSSVIEKEDMLYTIIGITIAAFFIFLIIIIIANKVVSQKVFKDFYKTIDELDNFSISENKPLTFNNTNITEFKKLNNAIEKLSAKAIREYKSLREFTEETNHEIQTPLAIAKSNLEILLQNEKLTENDLIQVNTALINLNRLERVNKSILLLNKLEHKNLFDNAQLIVEDEIKNVLLNFSDFITSKNLIVETKFADKISINANQSLINILFSNLISNAIKHNNAGGNIFIELKDDRLILSNSAVKQNYNTSKFFNRFYKESPLSDSVGLGLTIAKKICDLYNFDLSIDWRDKLIITSLYFNKAIVIK
jgi:signal transduction histidine kinase